MYNVKKYESSTMRYLFLLLPLLLAADLLKVGDSVTPMVIHDQFDKPHAVGNESVWVVTWDKMTTRYANRFFDKHPGLIAEGKAALIVDVSQTPEGIMSLFVLPRMRSFDHAILLSYDAKTNRTFPYEEDRITVLKLEGGRIVAIGFAEGESDLNAVLP